MKNLSELQCYLVAKVVLLSIGWENWYQHYNSCNEVAFVNDLLVWIDHYHAESPVVRGTEPMEIWEELALDYDNNLTNALFQGYKTVKHINKSYKS